MANPTYLIPVGTDAAADLNGTWFDLGDLINAAIQVAFTGSNVVGTLTLQGSNDQVTAVTIANSSQAITASGPHIWNITGAGYRFVRPVWDYTSGTGTISSLIYTKARG